MTSKEMEARSGVPRANIRYYEAEGLLAPARSGNGYRDYSEEDLRTLEKIKLLRRLSLDLDAIRRLQAGGPAPPLPPASRHNLVVHCLMDYRLKSAVFFMYRETVGNVSILKSTSHIPGMSASNPRLRSFRAALLSGIYFRHIQMRN